MRLRFTLTIWGLITCASLQMFGQTNEGREFWLGFMEHRDRGENTMVVMITSRYNTSGTIRIPLRGFEENFLVSADEVTVVELPNFVETVGSEFINNNGIQIVSQNDISVYMHQYFGMRSEASVVLPITSTGKTYFTICYTGMPEGFGPAGEDYPSEFLIVANHDESTIEYTLSGRSQNGKEKGSTHTISLNQGQVYQVRSASWDTDLTGSFIQSDKDISVFSGTPWSQVPRGCFAMDNLLEQMYPVSTWGTRYVGSSFFGSRRDIFRIIASENGTVVSVEGGFSRTFELSRGEYVDFESFDGQGAFVESNLPISVAQYMVGSSCNGDIGDPSMVVLNTVDQIRDDVTLYNSSFSAIDQNFINVICKNGEEDLVFVDGQQLVARGIEFQTIDQEQKFLYANVPTTAGAHNISTQGCGIIAMAYGYGNVESYAYSGGAAFAKINENPIPDGGCLSDTIFFDTGLPPKRYSASWDLGDGTLVEGHRFRHSYDNLGSYPLSVIIEDFCFDQIDTLYKSLEVTLRQDIQAFDDESACEGEDIQLGAIDLTGASYEWVGPDDFESDQQFPMITEARLSADGLYEVVGNISGCRTFPVSQKVTIHANPQPRLGADTLVCTVDGDIIDLDAGDYVSFVWQDGINSRMYRVDEEGAYWVDVMDDMGCYGSDTIQIVNRCPTRYYLPNIFSPNGDGMNDQFGVSGLDIISMDLQVFDRWGQLIFQSQDPSFHWDGTFENGVAEVGQYVWVMDYSGYLEDGTLFTSKDRGSVLLFR